MDLNTAKRILADADRDLNAAQGQIGGVLSSLAEANTKISAVFGQGYQLASLGAAIAVIEEVRTHQEALRTRIGAARHKLEEAT